MKKKALALAAAAFLGIGISYLFHSSETTLQAKPKSKVVVVAKKVEKDVKDTIPHYDEKVAAVRTYMHNTVRASKKNPSMIRITPEKIVEISYLKKFDIPLLLAQAHIESCFGTTRRARRTNSVFAVGSYDNGRDACKYRTQDECIDDYINLVNKKYLKKYNYNVNVLLADGNFVTGKRRVRYASNPSYERNLRNLRNKIIRQHPILLA